METHNSDKTDSRWTGAEPGDGAVGQEEAGGPLLSQDLRWHTLKHSPVTT